MQMKHLLLFIVIALSFGCSDTRLSDAIETFNAGMDDLLDWRSRDDAKIVLAEKQFSAISEDEVSQLYLGVIYGLYRVSKTDATWTQKSIDTLSGLKSKTDDANLKGYADQLIVLVEVLDDAYNESIVSIDATTQEIKDVLSDFQSQ